MKSFFKCGALLTLAWLSVGGSAGAQTSPYGSPSLLPFPETQNQVPTTSQVAYRSAAAPMLAPQRGPSLASNTDLQAPPEPPPANADGYSPITPATGEGSGIVGSLGGTDTSMFPSTKPACGCADGQCDNNGCLSCVPCCNGARWFGSVGGLFMTRNNANSFWTTYQTNVNQNQLMNTKEAQGNWGGGGQVTFGRWWCCGDKGIGLQFVYWQVWGMGGFTQTTSAGNLLSTPIDLGGVNITSGAGTFPAGDFFDNSPNHRIWRTDNVSNFELNVLNQQIYSQPNRVNLTCMAGFRYFRFQESLTFGSVADGFAFGDNGGSHEAYLQSKVTNNLFGAQIGVLGNINITPKWGAYAQPKIGIYDNSINATNRLYTGDGFQTFNIHSHQNAFSMLGEVDLGTYYWLSDRCQVFAGWRVVAVSQVALGDNQFLPFMADSAGFGQIKSNGDLILTGGFAGLAFTF